MSHPLTWKDDNNWDFDFFDASLKCLAKIKLENMLILLCIFWGANRTLFAYRSVITGD